MTTTTTSHFLLDEEQTLKNYSLDIRTF